MQRARAFLAGLMLTGCTGPFLPSEPRSTPDAVFETFWGDFDAYYSYFGDKGIDWDSVYAAHRPRIRENMSDSELFAVLVEMANGFKDGHITLQARDWTWTYDGWRTRSPTNYFPEAVQRRLAGAGSTLSVGNIGVGMLGERIGYLRIESFAGTGFDDAMNRALESLRNADALIVDIRYNGGGSDLNSDVVQGRFADQSRTYAYVQYRNGPSHDDFTVPRAKIVTPTGGVRFSGPVAVLTNRGVFSTAEAFVLAMSVLPNVTIVGDTTGGGAGNPVWRELPNGWNVRIPRWRMEDAERRSFEGVGIPPDVTVWITGADRVAGVDTILEAALRLLTEQIEAGFRATGMHRSDTM